MNLNNGCFQKYKNILREKDIDFNLLNNETVDLERLVKFFDQIDSQYLLPKDNEIKLQDYLNKILKNAYTFILSEKNTDIGIISLYLNDLRNKIAYCSSMGILPSYRGKNIAPILIDFGIQFSREMGMEYIKAEVEKSNSKMITLFTKYDFEIKDETENNSYIILKELKNQ